jgi:hypothetical protein
MQHVPGLRPGEGVVIASWLRPELAEQLAVLAQMNERSVSAETRLAIRNHIDRAHEAEAQLRRLTAV